MVPRENYDVAGSVLEEEERTKRAGVCRITAKVSQLTALSTTLLTERPSVVLPGQR